MSVEDEAVDEIDWRCTRDLTAKELLLVSVTLIRDSCDLLALSSSFTDELSSSLSELCSPRDNSWSNSIKVGSTSSLPSCELNVTSPGRSFSSSLSSSSSWWWCSCWIISLALRGQMKLDAHSGCPCGEQLSLGDTDGKWKPGDAGFGDGVKGENKSPTGESLVQGCRSADFSELRSNSESTRVSVFTGPCVISLLMSTLSKEEESISKGFFSLSLSAVRLLCTSQGGEGEEKGKEDTVWSWVCGGAASDAWDVAWCSHWWLELTARISVMSVLCCCSCLCFSLDETGEFDAGSNGDEETNKLPLSLLFLARLLLLWLLKCFTWSSWMFSRPAASVPCHSMILFAPFTCNCLPAVFFIS